MLFTGAVLYPPGTVRTVYPVNNHDGQDSSSQLLVSCTAAPRIVIKMDAGASSTLLSSSSSYQDVHAHDSSTDDIDSLPSTSASSTSISPSEDDLNDAEREWRESLQQLELILTMVLIPFVGKYFGRKTAYWGQFSAPSRLGQVTLRTLVLTSMARLGKVHGVVVPRSRRDHEQGLVQSRRHRRGRSRAVDLRTCSEDNEPKACRG